MERWVQLCILSLVAVVPGRAALDLTGNNLVDGIWKAPATLPCLYEPSSDFKQLKVTWKFSQSSEAPRTILHHDASEDHIFLTAFRDRVNVAKNPPGDVSLHIKKLEMTDIGSFVCLVELEAQNMSIISREKTVQLKVVKVPVSKPVVEASSQDSVLPRGTRMSLTCSASGSPPITYRWYKEGPEGEAEELRRGPLLAFESLQLSDSARYFCTAENRLNVQKEQSDSFQLTVKDASEVSTAGPAADSGGHTTETGTPVWNFVAGTSRRPEMTHTRTGEGPQPFPHLVFPQPQDHWWPAVPGRRNGDFSHNFWELFRTAEENSRCSEEGSAPVCHHPDRCALCSFYPYGHLCGTLQKEN
ncbi:V-set and immunoglobulin domain-containing protein 4 isoform X6 [Pantherophis guttatus]|uniref:V-set and immunoglobulin domain-containing protein 4 isoform X6 n=1 Tax=Pantherophis guttatus TaxID=94885 RepID=UPI001482A14B|nr:V-set and immunoglobulin domain-containing protein 4 isoform X6 [Pantherophis guttatus]XP_034291071.1 V-set and immunoglobulin domain-containing protein 4 isoform X6 [Pantherophis guttatus]